MRNILYIDTTRSMGGSSRSLYYLIKNLDRKKFRPFVVFYHQSYLTEKFKEQNAKIIHLKQPKNRVLRFLSKFLINPWKINSIIKQNEIDLVHTNEGLVFNFDAVLAAKKTETPVVVHVRGIRNLPSFQRRIAKKADGFIAVSDAVKKNYVRQGIDSRKIEVIKNGVDLNLLKKIKRGDIREEFKLPKNALVVGYFGRIIGWKGIDYLIKAMEGLIGIYSNLYFVVIGGGHLLKDFEAHIKKKRVTKRIIFTGFRKDALDLMKSVDIVVNYSTRPDPCPRSVIEAMACGKPVIGSDLGGIPELIQDGKIGMVVRSKSSNQLKKAIEKLILNKKLRQDMGKQGKESIKNNFEIKKLTRKIESFYEIILTKNDFIES